MRVCVRYRYIFYSFLCQHHENKHAKGFENNREVRGASKKKLYGGRVVYAFLFFNVGASAFKFFQNKYCSTFFPANFIRKETSPVLMLAVLWFVVVFFVEDEFNNTN